MMRLILSYLLVASLIAPSISSAETEERAWPVEVAALPSPASAKSSGAEIVVVHVPAAQEAELIHELAPHEDVVFLTARSHDPVNNELNGRDHIIFSADHPDEMPYFQGPQGSRELAKLKRIPSALKNAPVGLLVALIPASGYGAYYWYLTSEYLLSTGAFAWQYFVASAITLGNRHWLKFSGQVGRFTGDIAMLLGSAFGKTWSRKARHRWQRFGKVLSAYGLNLGTSTFLNFLSGVHQHEISFNAFVFLFALFASSEVVDYHSEEIFREEKRLRSAMIARLAIYSGIEIAALSGSESAEILAGTSVVAAILSFIFKEEFNATYSSFKRTLQRKWVQLKAKSPFKRKSSCADDLKSAA